MLAATTLRRFRFYDLLVNVFVVVLLVSNLVAQKIVAVGPFDLGFVQVGPFLISAAQMLFPITYIFGDVFVEVYGYAASRRAIWIGFFASALLALMSWIATELPAAPEFPNQTAFEAVFGLVPRVLAASLIAYWAGEFANAYVMSKMKILTRGRYLWTRTIGSTAVGQFVDTVIVMTIIFAGAQSWGVIANLIVSGYLAKVIYEAAATPLTYLVVNSLKRAEGLDAESEIFDETTDFNPFQA